MTFLEESALENDVAAVIFALNHNANTALKSSEYPLALTENYDIAQLLIDKGALEPFQNDPKEAFKLLRNALNFALSYRLLKLYSEKGLNLKLKNSDNDTLLHWLYGSFNLKYNKPYNFFEKFKTLYKAGAVDLNAKNKFKKTPLDLLNDVKETDQDNATVKLARALLEGLEKTPAERRKKLELLQQNPPENPVGLQELLYPMKNPRIFQSTQLSEKE
jgi:ankyrin repeat protein